MQTYRFSTLPDYNRAMCGRYVSPDDASLEREFNLVHAELKFSASYNVAPSQQVPVVRNIDGKLQGWDPTIVEAGN
jgi:putative SOS response-associated peptidase YedK